MMIRARNILPSFFLLLVCLFGASNAFAQGGTNQVEHHKGILFAEPDGVKLLLNLHMPKGVENPPLLIFHGDKDTTVYLDQSEHLKKLYQAAGLDVHLHIQHGAGHGWKPSSETERDLVLAFLHRHLGH